MLLFVEIIVVLVVAYSVLGWSLYFMQPTFLYKPVRGVIYTPEELDLEFEDVSLETADNIKLNAWFIPAKNARFTILYCHGNGGNIMHRLDTINIFYELGLNCFIFDYRGYGNSEGSPSEEGTYIDVETAYNWLINEKKIPPENIIIFGRSIGGSIATYLAGKVTAKALVVDSAFTSYVDIGKKFYPYMPVKWFARFKYDTISYIRKVNCPVMVIHSQNDEMIPFEFGQELFDAVREPKKFVEIYGSHNDGFLLSLYIYKQAWADWLEFLQAYDAQAGEQQAS
jgi:fermentation-respiration switch protein FrsA (DUF1100 family)